MALKARTQTHQTKDVIALHLTIRRSADSSTTLPVLFFFRFIEHRSRRAQEKKKKKKKPLPLRVKPIKKIFPSSFRSLPVSWPIICHRAKHPTKRTPSPVKPPAAEMCWSPRRKVQHNKIKNLFIYRYKTKQKSISSFHISVLYSKFVYSEEVRISFELSGITTEHSQPYKLRGQKRKKKHAQQLDSLQKKNKNRTNLETSTKQSRLKPEVCVSLKKQNKKTKFDEMKKENRDKTVTRR